MKITDEQRSEAIRLHKRGFGPQDISRLVGISRTSAFRLLNPDYAERARKQSRDAKRRRRGTCVDCGTETRYAGKGPNTAGVSVRCPACAAILNGLALRATGSRGSRVLELLSERPRRFMELSREVEISKGQTGQLLRRLRKYGLVVRIGRGLYSTPGYVAKSGPPWK